MVRLVHLVKSMVGGVVAPLFPRQADPRRGNLADATGRTTAPVLPQADFTETTLEATARHLLTSVGCRALARLVHVRWNRRLRTTAGLANYTHWTVALNPKVVPFGMEEVDRTLRHELAHLLARYRAGRRRIQPHGPEWRQACADLGLDGEKRCHELPLPRRYVSRKVVYRCRHCHAEVRRVRPFRRPVACLKCCRSFNRGRYDERYRFELVARG
ncbi:MAG: SprT-like domain-containing protein [Verrucomicrobiota bacterium]